MACWIGIGIIIWLVWFLVIDRRKYSQPPPVRPGDENRPVGVVRVWKS